MRRFSLPFFAPILMGALMLLVVACANNVPNPTPNPTPPNDTVETPITTVITRVNPVEITPTGDTGVLVGRVISDATSLPMSNTPIYLAEVFRENGEGAFVLNSVASPSTISDADGNFVHMNLKPAEYVIVVGDPHFDPIIVPNPETQTAQTYFIEAGRVTQVGELRLSRNEGGTPPVGAEPALPAEGENAPAPTPES